MSLEVDFVYGGYLNPEQTVGRFNWAGPACAGFTSTLAQGAKATFELVSLTQGNPGRLAFTVRYDDSAIPASVTLPPCHRIQDFAVQVWDFGE